MRKILLTIAFALLFGSAGWAQVDAQESTHALQKSHKAQSIPSRLRAQKQGAPSTLLQAVSQKERPSKRSTSSRMAFSASRRISQAGSSTRHQAPTEQGRTSASRTSAAGTSLRPVPKKVHQEEPASARSLSSHRQTQSAASLELQHSDWAPEGFSNAVYVSSIVPARLEALSRAIAKAEGYYIRGTIPNRYHNPGDLKSRPGLTPLAGQRKIGKAGHIVFVNDAAGWAALREYLTGIAEGRRKHYVASMTLSATSRVYAQRWQPWLRIVTKELGVPGSTPINVYLKPDYSLVFLDGFCYTL
jgi:hypothetical protein